MNSRKTLRRRCARAVLHGGYAQRRMSRWFRNNILQVWRSNYAKSEASFEARDQSCPGVRGCWIDLFAGRRRIRSSRPGNGRAADAEHCAGPRHHSRRRGNRRRQPGDVLRVRQGEHRIASGPRSGSPWLRWLQGLRRQGLQRLSWLQGLQRLRRLWLRRRRLLSVLGWLPRLLERTAFGYIDKRESSWPGSTRSTRPIHVFFTLLRAPAGESA
jgi:hypothetical protein